MKTLLMFACAALAPAAAAGTLPNAGEADVLRFGPYASALVDVYTRDLGLTSETGIGGGGGAGFGGQYDCTWVGFALRVEAAALNRGYAIRYVDLDTEYYFYLLKRGLRPFVMPRLGFGYGSGVGRYPWMENRRYAPVGLYIGGRWNRANSPFYTTLAAGYRLDLYGLFEGHGARISVVNNYYFGLTDTFGLNTRLGVERADGYYYEEGYVRIDEVSWQVRLDVGPSWAF